MSSLSKSPRGWSPFFKSAAALAFAAAANGAMADDQLKPWEIQAQSEGYVPVPAEQDQRDPSKLDYDVFFKKMQSGEITKVMLADGKAIGSGPKISTPFKSEVPGYENIFRHAAEAGLNPHMIEEIPSLGPTWLERNGGTVTTVALFAAVIGIWLYMANRQKPRGGGSRPGGMFGFGKSKAKKINSTATFMDVAGCDEAKEEVKELVDFLKDPKKFTRLGGRMPRGVLLVGPPGTGKTLLAKAVAGEAKVPFFSISGSDFVEMFVGVGAARVRDLFEEAKRSAPAIIFVDEIDAVGRHRGHSVGGGNDEREQTLNQMLVEMDGFETNLGVIVMAATNRPDILDPALLRPGRFDRQVYVTLPDIRGREEILSVHMRKIPAGKDVVPNIIARGTPQFSGADLGNLVNEAALFAARRDADYVEMQDFEKAKDKIMMGTERKSLIMPEEERINTAYHEFGHAIVTHLSGGDPVHKITIIPRGRALGVMVHLPEKDRYSINAKQMKAQIAGLYGGRIAEGIFHGDPEMITTGASNDIERVTQIANDMVKCFGFSDLGVLYFDEDKKTGRPADISEHLKQGIEKAVREISDAQYQLALKLLTENVEILHKGARFLLEEETIDREQFLELMAGKTPQSRFNRQAEVLDHLKRGIKNVQDGKFSIPRVGGTGPT